MKKFFSLLVFYFLVYTSLCAQSLGVELSKLQTYRASPYPVSGVQEVYDFRKNNGLAVPKTFVDTFICDIWMLIVKENPNVNLTNLNLSNINVALDIYINRDFAQISGYRPWTHSNFIKSLSQQQRNILAQETLNFIQKNGVWYIENFLSDFGVDFEVSKVMGISLNDLRKIIPNGTISSNGIFYQVNSYPSSGWISQFQILDNCVNMWILTCNYSDENLKIIKNECILLFGNSRDFMDGDSWWNNLPKNTSLVLLKFDNKFIRLSIRRASS